LNGTSLCIDERIQLLCQRPPSELRDGIALGAQSLLDVSD
jgi:hypothetical protein